MTRDMDVQQFEELLGVLKTRFEKNLNRHHGLDWAEIQTRLESAPPKLWSLNEMEKTGGEPDVVGYDLQTGEYIFCDCSVESPAGRRSVCYDQQAFGSKEEKQATKQRRGDGGKDGHCVINRRAISLLANDGTF